MAIPTFEAFSASVRSALAEVDANEQAYALFDKMGRSFNFYDDGGIDSLEMLEIVYHVKHDFVDIDFDIESLIHHEEPMTLENLYSSIQSIDY